MAGQRSRQTAVIAALLLCLVSTGMSAGYRTLTELKQTALDPEVEKALADLVEKGVEPKTKQFKKQMDDVVQAINQAVHLTDDEIATLNAAADKAVAESLALWKPGLVRERRVSLDGVAPAQALGRIHRYNAETVAVSQFVEGATRPDQLVGWQHAVRTCLGLNRYAVWEKEQKARDEKRGKEIDAYLDPIVTRICTPLQKELSVRVETMVKECKLSESQGKALDESVKKVISQIRKREGPRTAGMLQTLTDDIWSKVSQRNGSLRLDIPTRADDIPEWAEAVKKVLTPEQLAYWQKSREEREKALAADIAKDLKAMRDAVHDSQEDRLKDSVMGIEEAASLSPEHDQQLKAAVKTVVDAYMEEWQKKMVESLAHMSEAQRVAVFARHLGISVNMTGGNNVSESPAWRKKLDEILSPEERGRWQAAVAARQNMAVRNFARIGLAEMDRRVLLTRAQREKLEPLLEEVVKDFLSSHEFNNQEDFTFDERELLSTIAKGKQDAIAQLLDQTQSQHWKLAAQSDPNTGRQRFTAGGFVAAERPKTVPVKSTGKRAEPPSVESSISQYLHDKSAKLMETNLSAMQLKVEEAARIADLPADAVARLTTAAKGSVDVTMSSWKMSMDQWVRSQLKDATPQNVRPRLDAIGTVTFGRQNSADEAPLWKSTVEEVMPPEKLKAWREEQEARHDYFDTAVAGAVIRQLQRHCPVSPDQEKKLEPLVKKVLEEYEVDIQSWLSEPWYLSSYYSLIPLAGVPEKKFAEVFGADQLKRLKEDALPQAEQYWEGIKQQHDQRLNQGNQQMIFSY